MICSLVKCIDAVVVFSNLTVATLLFLGGWAACNDLVSLAISVSDLYTLIMFDENKLVK